MLSLKDKAEIYRIGLITGYFTKNDVISWVDKIIETQENIEYELIETSLLVNSSKIDIASKLFKISGITDDQLVINTFIGLCTNSYNSNNLTDDEIFTLIYRLVSNKIDISISRVVKEKIHYLSDGYYLATKGIYGEIKDICSELKKFLEPYTIYAKEFGISC